ncbi:hypothetical protein SHAb15599_00077 [Acinetobacter phage SH-Ab 15599]|nr:hypothetical protein SHAb15599_00077 [Acinetobacter phage SH-Ab 15599]
MTDKPKMSTEKCDYNCPDHSTCFYCNFWDEAYIKYQNGKLLVNQWYVTLSDGGHKPNVTERDRSFLGHAGRLFKFKLKDGTTFESNNVWSAGTVPEPLRHKFIPNCETSH